MLRGVYRCFRSGGQAGRNAAPPPDIVYLEVTMSNFKDSSPGKPHNPYPPEDPPERPEPDPHTPHPPGNPEPEPPPLPIEPQM